VCYSWWASIKFLAWSLLGRGSSSSLASSDSTSDGIAELLYVLFLVLGTIMLMNMMIALLSNTYQSVEVKNVIFKNDDYCLLFKKKSHVIEKVT
jgi:hypothetical protein